MTGEQFHDVLTLLPEDLVAQADELRSRRPKVVPWRQYAAMAACLAVLLYSAVFIQNIRKKSAKTETAVSFSAAKEEAAADTGTPRIEAAQGAPETSGSEATADSAIAFTCVETPDNLHTTACYTHSPSATVIVSREELDAYLSKWDRLYLLDTLRDACLIYDADWFASQDLLLIPVDGVSAGQTCVVTEVACQAGHCEITIALTGEETNELTNYHVAAPVEKGAVSGAEQITVIYNSDTIG